MGSFTELSLSFNFRADTPSEVLASVVGLRVAGALGPVPEPVLPAQVVEPLEFFDPTFHLIEWVEPDPYFETPWAHNWAAVLSRNAAIPTTPTSTLIWNAWLERWYCSCRCVWKSPADLVHRSIEWLAPFVDTYGSSDPVFVGTMQYDVPRPHLLFVDRGTLTVEWGARPTDY